MASIISASTTSGTALNMTADTSGVLQIATGATPTTAVTIDTSQNVTLAGTLAMSSSFLRNRIINGDMRIDQRNAGASQVITTTSFPYAYTLDRWSVQTSQASKITSQQNKGAVTPPVGFSNYLGLSVSTTATVGSTDFFVTSHGIELNNMTDLSWGTANAKAVTISFWAYSSSTGTFGASITNGPQAVSYPFLYTISSANTWTYITVTIPGPTIGAWTATNLAGIYLYFGIGVGSTYSGTANTWASTLYLSATGGVNLLGTSAANFYITGVQLEVGSTATPFERRMYGTELALCQRYCLKLGGDSAYTPYGTGNNYSTTNGNMVVTFPVSMRTTPTLTVTTPNRVLSGSVANSVTAMSLGNGGALGVYLDYTSTGLTVGQGSFITANGSTAANLLFTAEL